MTGPRRWTAGGGLPGCDGAAAVISALRPAY